MKTPQQNSRIDDLHRKLRQIDEERAKVLEELNDVEPPISVLPPEILCLIFHFARPSGFYFDGYRMTKLFCGLKFVSKHWRWVLLSNPAIWTKVHLRISNLDPRRDAEPLLPFITHSGQLPLSLGIEYASNSRSDNKTLIHSSVDPFLLKNLGRVKYLHLESPPLAWFSHLALLERTIHLNLLNASDTVLPPLSLHQAVSLSELTVERSPDIRLASALPITTLTLISMPIDSSFHIFRNCPNLRNLDLSCGGLCRETDFPVDSFTLPHLERLHWKTDVSGPENWYIAIMTHIHLPSLRMLEWRGPKQMECRILGRAVTGFFTRLPITLTSLKLHGLWSHSDWDKEVVEDNIYEFLPFHCHLESIEFIQCTMRYFISFLEKIQSPHRFPQLRTIKMNGMSRGQSTSLYTEVEEELVSTCLALLQNRINVSDIRFILELWEMDLHLGGMDVGLLAKVSKALAKLNESGCVMMSYTIRNNGSLHEITVEQA